MRIVWRDYVKSQLAWWRSLSKLAGDPSIGNRDYLSVKALSAFANARDAAALPYAPRPAAPRRQRLN